MIQEIEKYNMKINVIPKAIEKYMTFTIKQHKKDIRPEFPLVFIFSIHFLDNSFDDLVANLDENYFYHLSQKFNANVLDLLKKKWFFPISIFFPFIRGESHISFRTHCVIITQRTWHPPPPSPAICVISGFFTNLIFFQKNFLNVFRMKIGKLHLWGTVWFMFDYFANQFRSSSFVDYSRK